MHAWLLVSTAIPGSLHKPRFHRGKKDRSHRFFPLVTLSIPPTATPSPFDTNPFSDLDSAHYTSSRRYPSPTKPTLQYQPPASSLQAYPKHPPSFQITGTGFVGLSRCRAPAALRAHGGKSAEQGPPAGSRRPGSKLWQSRETSGNLGRRIRAQDVHFVRRFCRRSQ